MSKVLVMYYSENGSTKTYAEWIAEELNGDLCFLKDIKASMLSGYDVILLASPLLGGPIKGLNILVENYNAIKDKKLVLCACGIEDMGNEMITNRIRGWVEKAVPSELFLQLKLFFLRGGFNHYKLSLKNRVLFWLAMKKINKTPVDKLTVDEKLVLETYGKKLDFTDKTSIKPIVEYCS